MDIVLVDWLLIGDCYIEHELSFMCPSDRWKERLIEAIEHCPVEYPKEELLLIKHATDSLDTSSLNEFRALVNIGGQSGQIRVRGLRIN